MLRQIVAVIIVNMALTMVWPSCAEQSQDASVENQEERISMLFKRTRTICVGRFLIDVPFESEVIYGPAYIGVNLEVIIGAAQDYERIIANERLDVLRDAQFAYDEMRGPSSKLGRVIDGVMPSQKILFAVESGMFYQLRSFIKLGEDLLVTWTTALPDPTDYEKKIATLNSIANSIIARQDDMLPLAPGLCIAGGLVPLPSASVPEQFSLGVRLKTFSDVHFSLEMIAKDEIVLSDALDQRIRDAELGGRQSGNAEWYSRIKTIRRGKHSLWEWEGYEFLVRKPEQMTQGECHEFAFVSHGRAKDPKQPMLDLSMHSGMRGNAVGAVIPSITDAEAVLLWDRLTKSIRPRPTAKID